MNTQNVFKYYGSKIDLKLDSSEYYDLQLSKDLNDFNTDVLDLSAPIEYESLIIFPSCFTGSIEPSIPLEISINEEIIISGCTINVRRRTEKGWTLDFIFNRNSLPWYSGNTFYYWGIKDEINPDYYLDNNLSFSFTEDGRIMWEAIHYSGYCETNSGYTETNYIASGQTPILCSTGLTNDFNVTITFERYKYLIDCEIENDGGWNDLITGKTINNPLDVITGATEDYTIFEQLNKKWNKERDSRLGKLKIYLNGRPIYKLENWEEIVPSNRLSENPIVQIWGGGTTGCEGIHVDDTNFMIKQYKYFEEPLDAIHVYHHYVSENSVNFDITECGEICEENFISIDSPTNIIIDLDPGNILSYPETGTTIYNLIDPQLYGNMIDIIYSDINNGIFEFNGSTSYIEFLSYNFTDTFTVLTWIYPQYQFNMNTLFSNTELGTISDGFKIIWNDFNNDDGSIDIHTGNNSVGNILHSASGVIEIDKWQQIAISLNRLTQTGYVYKNGVRLGGLGSISPNFNVNRIWRIGSTNEGFYPMKGYLGTFKVYDSILTDSNILSEFNFYKSRYGL